MYFVRGGYRKIGYLFSILIVFGVAVASIKYTFILNVHGGGKYLFGGSYLIIFFWGMLFGSFDIKFSSIKYEIINSIISVIAVGGWYKFLLSNQFQIDAYFPLGDGFNPPSISLIVYGIFFVWVFYSLFSLAQECKVKAMREFMQILNWLGKYSLYIFLYHRLILNYFLVKINVENNVIKAVIYLFVMVFVPIAGKILFEYIKRLFLLLPKIN